MRIYGRLSRLSPLFFGLGTYPCRQNGRMNMGRRSERLPCGNVMLSRKGFIVKRVKEKRRTVSAQRVELVFF